MREGGLDVGKLVDGVSVTIEREPTAVRERARRQREVEILACRIAVDFDGDAFFRRDRKDGLPVRNDSCSRSGNAATRMGENPYSRISHGGGEPRRLVVGLSQM